ncbi:hypothetical protein MJL33_29650, partial [Salmonella enterica subsp. enterica serovar Kentucky]|nr:hypothetical protein [Salmonella enterica subsp. enterica serovar Kentucky]
FIHGMKISLQQHIPGISIQSVGQAEELWQKIESAPDALVMLEVEPQTVAEPQTSEVVEVETTHPEVIAAPVDEQPQLIAESDTP